MDVSALSKSDTELIAKCFLFRGLDRSDVTGILSDGRCRIQTYEKGGVIYDVHSYSREISLILRGRVRADKVMADGSRFVMNTLGAGSIFGVAAVFNDEEDYVTTLTAMEKSRMVFLPQELLREMMRRDFTVAENYIAFLSGRIRFLNGRIDALVVSGSSRALAKYLFTASVDSGTGELRLPVTISTLASMLNMGRASLYRAFDELEKNGLIEKNGKTITIKDKTKLEEYLR